MIPVNLFHYKQAWLSLKKRPGFIAAVVSTMGITLGALICVLTLAYLLLFQPLPYPEQERLYQAHYIEMNESGLDQEKVFTFPAFLHLYESQKANKKNTDLEQFFDEMAMLFYTKNVVTSLPHQPTLPVTFASPEIMSMLDIPMALGRRFDKREEVGSFNPVAVISYDTWQNDFALDPEILSKKVEYKGRQFKIIGVTAANFIEPQINRQGINTAVWFTWDYHLGQKFVNDWDGIHSNIALIGKLKASTTIKDTEHSLTPQINDLRNNNADLSGPMKDWTVRIALQPLSSVLLGESNNTVYFLLAGVIGLVLIASANITNLFISRTAEQQRNLAIQAALGAKKSQLKRMILAEASILMALAVMAALLIATTSFSFIKVHLVGVLPRVEELVINTVTFTSAVILAVIAALFFSYISSKMVNYRELNKQLQSSGKGTGIQVSKKIRQVLISSQVAIATVLVFANLVLFTNAMQKINAPTGLDLSDIVHASFSVSAPTYPDESIVLPIMLAIKQELLSLPQVESVDRSFSYLSEPWTSMLTDPVTNEAIKVNFKPVGDDFFSMSKQVLIAGNYFKNADLSSQHDVDVILSEDLAEIMLPGENIIGKTFNWGDITATVIGIVKTANLPAPYTNKLRVYVPVLPALTKMNIKLLPNQTLSRTEVVNAIKAVTPLYALYALERLKNTEDKLLFSQYVTAITTASLAIITLLLATIGLYGILSYGTQMRRFEIGTRMAIGAKGKDIIYLLISNNAKVIAVGVVSSIMALLALYSIFYASIAEFLNFTLLGIYVLTLIVITLLCFFACYWPLRQFINNPVINSLRGGD